MKIAHIVDSMKVGGAETLVSQLCRLQQKEGHDPSVYVVGGLGELGEQMRAEGFVVQACAGRRLPDAMRNFYYIFKKLHPDVVHLHNPTPTVYAAMAARMAKVPSIVSTRHGLIAAPRRAVVEARYALAAACCDWAVGVCQATVNNLREIHSVPARKLIRIYNGTAPLQPVAKEQCPQKSGFTFVYVGRLVPVKNLRLLLMAFYMALQSLPCLRLWIVGDGSERKMLEDLAAELSIRSQVTFWGQQLNVAPFMSAADAFVMSSSSEGLPLSLLQAFSLGLPVLVTEVGGMAEAARMAQAGITVSATDPAKMAAAMQHLANREAERKRFSANAKRAFQSYFTLQAMAKAYMDCYRDTPRMKRAEKS
jgi:glycosyltransferase involved in cell wall biosynthesis